MKDVKNCNQDSSVGQASRNIPWAATLLNTRPRFGPENDSVGLGSLSFPGSYEASEN